MHRGAPRDDIPILLQEDIFTEINAVDTPENCDNSNTTTAICSTSDILSWHFDIRSWLRPNTNTTNDTTQQHRNIQFVLSIAKYFDLTSRLAITDAALASFVLEIESEYAHQNAYHNFYHALDVLQTVATFLYSMGGAELCVPSSSQQIALFIAALGVDIGHTGKSNATMMKTATSITKLPILESIHVDTITRICREHQLLAHLDKAEQSVIYETITDAILRTEMEGGHALLQSINKAHKTCSSTLYCSLFLQAANISSLGAKGVLISSYWMSRFVAERRQNDEKESGCLFAIPEYQGEWIEEVIVPTFTCLSEVLPNAASVILASVKQTRSDCQSRVRASLNATQRRFIREIASSSSNNTTLKSKMVPVTPSVKTQDLHPLYKLCLKATKAFKSHNIGSMLSLCLTFYALFAEDIRIAFLPKSCDEIMTVATSIVIILLGIEVVIQCIAKPEYRKSFYFYLDIACAASLFVNVSPLLFKNDDISTPLKSIQATRSIRLIRIFQLFRLSKLVSSLPTKHHPRFRLASLGLKQHRHQNSKSSSLFSIEDISRILGDASSAPNVITQEHLKLLLSQAFADSKVLPSYLENLKKKLASTSRRFSFTRDSSASTKPSYEIPTLVFLCALEKLGGIEKHSTTSSVGSEIDQQIPTLELRKSGASKLGTQVTERITRRVIVIVITMLLVIPHFSTLNEVSHNDALDFGFKRLEKNDTLLLELEHFASTCSPLFMELDNNTVAKNYSSYLSLDAVLIDFRDSELYWTTTMASRTSYAVFDISKSTRNEALLNVIKTLFVAMCLVIGSYVLTRDTHKAVVIPVERMISLVHSLARNPLAKISDIENSTATYEIKLLQDTLVKIATLLQIGFGEAGASVISANIQSGGSFHSVIPGKKIYGVFGFINIQSFESITGCLREEVMLFVNSIGLIVHEGVHEFGGYANRNLGDAFVLVWKLPKNAQLESTYVGHTDLPTHLAKGKSHQQHRTRRRTERLYLPSIADNALLAFLKVMVNIHNSSELRQYGEHPALDAKFNGNFNISMGYGLHIGWAIEGTIGSCHKIDASYLAPDVNMASRLEAAAAQYDVPLLMSHCFYNCLSPRKLQPYCRMIDCVLVKGSANPIGLYTFDITNFPAEFQTISDAQFLQENMPPSFVEIFKEAVDAFLIGDWKVSVGTLKLILERVKPTDGPSKSLLKFIESSNGECPPEWPGYHQLMSK